MRLINIMAGNFKGFKLLNLELNGRNSVIFGVNGTGKSSVLSAVNYAFWRWINPINMSQSAAFKSFSPQLVHNGFSMMFTQVTLELNQELYTIHRTYTKPRAGKNASTVYSKKEYDHLVDAFVNTYLSDDTTNMPIFASYGTNRSVLDIPLRIRQKHQFSKEAALEHATDNKLDFKLFFEWFRNQEDYENEHIRETGDREYQDRCLKCVRIAVESMMDGFTDLRVKRNPLRMVVRKGNVEMQVNDLSDGEKCTLALFGDLARRIAMANPSRENPLEGEGIVLIDEIELHMHPSWQRRILNVLKKVFPNIQFVVTTHSPQVLSEVGEDCAIFMLSPDMQRGTVDVQTIKRMDGFSSNEILEEFMDTRAENPAFTQLVKDASDAIQKNDFTKAEQLISLVQEAAGEDSAAAIRLEGHLKRGRILYAKNH